MACAIYAIHAIYKKYMMYAPYIACGAGDNIPATRAGMAPSR